MTRWPIALGLVLLFTLSGQAQVAPEVNKPYRLEVVLDVARDRLLTEVFREQVRRELEEGLQASYGDMVLVRVIDSIDTDARLNAARKTLLKKTLEDVRKLGLQKALDGWKDLNPDGTKTHFVLVDHIDGQYVVQARQQDGLTGQASPVARRDFTADRSFVSRLAMILIDRDLGIIGTVPEGADPKRVPVQLKGASLGVDIGRWVQKGDVFIVVPIPRGRPQALSVSHAYLVVEEPPTKDTCICKLFDRSGRALKVQGMAGYRCMKIHTIKAPLRIRVVQRGRSPGDPGTPGASIKVTVRRKGLEGDEAEQVVALTDADGNFSTARGEHLPYERIAFVEMDLRPRRALVPVALVDDRPTVIRIDAQTQDALAALRKSQWDQSAYDLGLAQQALFGELKEMESKPKERGRILDKAKKFLASSQESRKELGKEREELVRDKLDTLFGDSWLKFVDEGHTRLERYIQEQERIDKEENDPKRLEFLALVRQAELEASRTEFGKAIELFDKALGLGGYADDRLKQHVAKLKEQWRPRDEPHRLARAYLYETFPKVNLVKTKEALDEARKHFQICRGHGDTLTPQKLLQEILAHGGKLRDQEKALEPEVNEEDRNLVKIIADVAADLRKLGTEVQAYLQENAGK